MRVTIAVSDDTILVDGNPRIVDCSRLLGDVHAVQWYDDAGFGEVEYFRDHRTKPHEVRHNKKIDSLAEFSDLIDAYFSAPTPQEHHRNKEIASAT